MQQLFGKAHFIHRRLWQRDKFYPVALLIGPAVLSGAAVAAAIWAGTAAFKHEQAPPPWAAVTQVPTWDAATDQPQAAKPRLPLPALSPDGMPAGYEAGWHAVTVPVEINGALSIHLRHDTLTTFPVDANSIEMKQIIANGPSDGRYAGVGEGLLAIRQAGIYTLSGRFERAAAPRADCLVRLGFAGRLLIANAEIAVTDNISRTYAAVPFDLRPGLYPVTWIFGCWRGSQVIGPGRMTVLLKHPGDPSLAPARPGDVVRPRTAYR